MPPTNTTPPPLTSELQTIYSAWQVAEEFMTAECTLEAIQLLQGLLAVDFSAAAVQEEVQTRIRLAEILLDCTQNPEVARKVLEPSIRHFSNHVVTMEERIAVLRLLSVAARRRSQYSAAQQYLTRCTTLLAEMKLTAENEAEVGSPTSPTRKAKRADRSGGDDEDKKKLSDRFRLFDVLSATVAVESARLHFSRALTTNFSDAAATAALNTTAEKYSTFAANPETVPHATMLSLCFVMGLVFDGRIEAAQEHLAQAIALFGNMPEFTYLQSLVEFSFGRGASGIATSAAAKVTGEEEDTKTGSLWLSAGCVSAMRCLLELFQLSTSSKHTQCVSTFNELIDNVEKQMREVTSAQSANSGSGNSSIVGGVSGGGAATTHAEMRCLVGIKVVAYIQVTLSDLTRLDLCAAASKIDPLVNYVMMFHKHTAHFRADLHALIALFAIMMRMPEEAIQHAKLAITSSVDRRSSTTVKLIQAMACYSVRHVNQHYSQSFEALLDELRLEIPLVPGGSTAAAAPTQSPASPKTPMSPTSPSRGGGADGAALSSPYPRQRVMLSLLVGANYIDQCDYPRAISALKKCADEAKTMYGIGNPIVGQSLRLLAAAHNLAGNVQQSEAALTTATSLGQKANDELSMIHCLVFSLKNIAVVTDADKQRQRYLHKNVEDALSHYSSQLATAQNEMKEVKNILGFTPERQDYARWMAKLGQEFSSSSSGNSAAGAVSPTAGGVFTEVGGASKGRRSTRK